MAVQIALSYVPQDGPGSRSFIIGGKTSSVILSWTALTGRVLPGESLSARVSLGSTDSPQAQPQITPEERVGRFRIEFALCAHHADDSDDCEVLPQAARESNAFELRFAEP